MENPALDVSDDKEGEEDDDDDDDDDETNSEDDSELERQLDRGRSWLVLVGTFLTCAFSVGNCLTLSTLIQFIQQRLTSASGEQPPTFILTLLFALSITFNYITGVVAAIITAAVGYRKTIAAGAVVAMLGFGLAALATRTWQLMLTMGVMVGIGSGLIYTPCIGVLSYYFSEKYFNFAGSVASTGAGAGIMAYSFIHPNLMANLGWYKAMLCESALCSVLFVGAVFIKYPDVKLPRTTLKKKTKRKKNKVEPENVINKTPSPTFELHAEAEPKKNHQLEPQIFTTRTPSPALELQEIAHAERDKTPEQLAESIVNLAIQQAQALALPAVTLPRQKRRAFFDPEIQSPKAGKNSLFAMQLRYPLQDHIDPKQQYHIPHQRPRAASQGILKFPPRKSSLSPGPRRPSRAHSAEYVDKLKILQQQDKQRKSSVSPMFQRAMMARKSIDIDRKALKELRRRFSMAAGAALRRLSKTPSTASSEPSPQQERSSSIFRRLLHPELFRNYAFYLLMLESTAILANDIFLVLTPPYLSDTQGWKNPSSPAAIILIYGIASLLSRLFVCTLNARPQWSQCIPKVAQVAFGIVLNACAALAYLFAPQQHADASKEAQSSAPPSSPSVGAAGEKTFFTENNVWLFSVFAAICGCGESFFFSYQTPLLHEILPSDALTASFGYENVVLGILTIALCPIAGLAADLFGTLRYAYAICLGFCTISICALTTVVLHEKRRKRRNSSNNSSNSSSRRVSASSATEAAEGESKAGT